MRRSLKSWNYNYANTTSDGTNAGINPSAEWRREKNGEGDPKERGQHHAHFMWASYEWFWQAHNDKEMNIKKEKELMIKKACIMQHNRKIQNLTEK